MSRLNNKARLAALRLGAIEMVLSCIRFILSMLNLILPIIERKITLQGVLSQQYYDLIDWFSYIKSSPNICFN